MKHACSGWRTAAAFVAFAGFIVQSHADAPPVSLVSFGWSTSGVTTPSAGANCDAGCDNTSGCNSTPNSYSDGGAAMFKPYTEYLASRSCGSVCGGLGIGGSYGQINAVVRIASPGFDGTAVHWDFAGSTSIQAGAFGGDALCGASFASSLATGSQSFDAVFDAVGGGGGGAGGALTLMMFGNYHQVAGSAPMDGGAASSAWILERVGGPVLAADSINNDSGSILHTGALLLDLPAARYHLHIAQSAVGSHSAPSSSTNDRNSSAESRWNIFFEPYACASIANNPQSAQSCGPGPTSFTVGASGSNPVYQWQWRPVGTVTWNPVAAGLNAQPGTGAPAFTATGVDTQTIALTSSLGPSAAPAAQREVRAVVSNACGSGISPSVTWVVCLADFNCSGGSPTVQDIFDFLAGYFGQDPRADFNGSGTISVQDIFDFLAAYFAGC